ncbi:DnaT-like ssDNA-binding domain-containing protein [Halomonas sp. Mc5H-6]|uniref:DnaT-like ssDNA-binding domain-containing protein n=1 Tax=Halomonas sp. Mc5H-6 TaxID=2954500 RepID=UPI002096F57F|nr:DnaT-like ssDNA-binding domain-containing protein [Halomonas sp. Mc5H-6]MCO7246398.1 DnaT-like ssDNA-binding domain-containing protein [Halomonas sp. Mc5H-6]
MQYLVSINQTKALEWGLNAQQAMLFAFLHQVPTWADSREIDGVVWFNIGKGKVIEELPLLTDKPDTVYRLMKQLRGFGLICMTSCDNKTYIHLTEKAKGWNRAQGSEKNPTSKGKEAGSEKYPTHVEKSDQGRKNIREGSEKSPTNQDTKIITPSHTSAGDEHDSPPPTPNVFEQAAQQADDGEPAADDQSQPRKTAMTLDWEPEPETYATACWSRGLAPDANVHAALIDFREYFAAQPSRTNTQADWTRRFVRWVSENQQRQRTAPATTGGNAHANRRSSTPKRRQTAQEARAAAEGRAPAGSGDTFDAEWLDVHHGG